MKKAAMKLTYLQQRVLQLVYDNQTESGLATAPWRYLIDRFNGNVLSSLVKRGLLRRLRDFQGDSVMLTDDGRLALNGAQP